MCAECTGWSEIVKVFLSYGHDRNAPLVDRIGRDLEAAGHEVWIDKSEIKAGEHWRRSIVDGLQDTDWVLAVLSRHSVRDPGVCLDEIGIALHAKGGAIATVLVENDAKVDPPVSVSHIQWLDMRDWAERQAKGGPEWENWYNNKRGEILALLASPDVQRFAGEIKELDGLLAPVSQQGDIGALVDGFVGRAWSQRQVDEWRQTAKDSRLLWISGSAGTGKSAFSAWLGHRGTVNVIALNLCAYNREDRPRREPRHSHAGVSNRDTAAGLSTADARPSEDPRPRRLGAWAQESRRAVFIPARRAASPMHRRRSARRSLPRRDRHEGVAGVLRAARAV